jgi:predicted nucleotidyltransferase
MEARRAGTPSGPVHDSPARAWRGDAKRALALKIQPDSKVMEATAGNCYTLAMERDEVISRLQQHEADLKKLGVEGLYLFGSTVRGEAGDDSDVDLFFDYQKGKLGLFELMDVKAYAASILGRKTDIMTRDSLHKMLRPQIEASAVRVF